MKRVTTGLSYAILSLSVIGVGCGSGSPLKPVGGSGGSGGATAMPGADGAMLTCADRVAAIKAKLDPVVTGADRTCKGQCGLYGGWYRQPLLRRPLLALVCVACWCLGGQCRVDGYRGPRLRRGREGGLRLHGNRSV